MSPPSRERFEALLARAGSVYHLPYEVSSGNAYLAAGHWVVDHSDLVVAVWDAHPARGKGGTGDVVEYARRVGRPLLIINPATCTVTDAYDPPESKHG